MKRQNQKKEVSVKLRPDYEAIAECSEICSEYSLD